MAEILIAAFAVVVVFVVGRFLWFGRHRGQVEAPTPLPPYWHQRVPGAFAPPLSGSLDAAVRKALGIEVRLGALGIDAPRLRQGRHDTVKVAISRGPTAEAVISAFVAQSQVTEVEVIDTSAVMFVDLTGNEFLIKRLNPPEGEQIVSDAATWEFDVLPLAAGFRRLTVSASMRIAVPGHGERTVSVPSFTRRFAVEVDRVYAGRSFVRRNWQWIGTTLVAVAAVAAGIIWH